MDHEEHVRKKFVNMKSQRVKVEDSFGPALEDESETIEHLLAEPKSEYVTVDGVLCFDKENAEKGLNMEDFSYGYDFGLNTYSGEFRSAHPRGRHDELELGVLDGLLDEVDEVEDIDAINGLASPCDDYLLDIGFIGQASQLGFGPCEGSRLRNSSSASQSPGLSGSSNSAVGISESSTVTIQEFECKNSSIDKAVTHGSHGNFRQKKRHRTPVAHPASINLQNLDELDNDEKPSVRFSFTVPLASTAIRLATATATATMCGILAVFGCIDNSQAKRSRIIELSRRLKHRGPDWSGLHCHGNCYLAHQRLAIVDPASGDQPLYNEDKTVVVTVNGEIYNHKQLRENLKSHQFRTGSDCEVIAHLYEEHGEEFVDMLDGMFSFVLLDTRDQSFIAARDAIGITPLYMGWGLDGSIWFASEMKALSDDCERFISFPPGHIYSSKQGELRRWYNPPWFLEQTPSASYDPIVLRKAFEKAVVKRLMTDVPFGVLLSGGLDSSLVAAVACRYLADSEAACQWGSQLHTFCIGLEKSPDLKAAREVAEYLGTRHHEFHFTVQEGIDALEEVIYHTETYDVTTIRASTPMFLMSRKIKSLGVKMVLSGEGSDEIFGGYLYFHKAPNKEEFHQETCQKIKALHLYDCLRANKSTSAWGVEARVPFLDKAFINIAMNIDPEWKMIRPGRIEKWVLRNAFDDDQKPYLPKHILYRQKEQFSDGVGYSWIDGLKDHANCQVTDSMLSNASFVYPENTPTTKEAYYYRTIFEKFFPKNAARSTVPGGPSVACSTAKAVEWDAEWSKNPDPSGRAALGIHTAAYEEAGDAENGNVVSGSKKVGEGAVEKAAAVV